MTDYNIVIQKIWNRRLCFLFGATLGLIYSCAKIVSPAGGPKDTIAPRLITAYPKNLSTGMKSGMIKLEFDEYTQIINPEAIQIVPYQTKKPKIYYKGKTLIIKLAEPLTQEMTYQIVFNGALADLNEKNAYKDLQYVFSTGAVIDSLTLSGVAKDAQNGKPAAGVIVGLYPEGGDSLFTIQPPLYYDLTDSNGIFHLKHLRSAKYLIRALKDVNGNYFFDQDTESIAFSTESIDLSNLDTLALPLRIYPVTEPKWMVKDKIAGRYGYYELIFNKQNFTPILSLEPADSFYSLFSPTKDTLRLWYTPSLKDTFKLSLTGEDTIPYKFKIYPIKERKIPENKGLIKTNLAGKKNDMKLWYYDTLRIYSDIPLAAIDTARILLRNDSLPILPLILEPDIHDRRKIKFINRLAEKGHYELTILPGALVNIFGSPSKDSLVFSFTKGSADEYGSIVIKTDSSLLAHHYIAELIGEISKKKTTYVLDKTPIKIPLLKPGNNILQIIIDENQNGIWDRGRYDERIQPENIILFPQPAVVRSKWETEIIITPESLGMPKP